MFNQGKFLTCAIDQVGTLNPLKKLNIKIWLVYTIKIFQNMVLINLQTPKFNTLINVLLKKVKLR